MLDRQFLFANAVSPSPEEYEALTQQVPDSALSILQDAAGVYSAGGKWLAQYDFLNQLG